MDRHDRRSSRGDAVHRAAVRHWLRGTPSRGPRRDDRNRIRDRVRIYRDRNPARAARGISAVCAHRIGVDADGAADRCLRVARRGALRPRLRAGAVVGLGGLHPGRAGVRAIGRYHRGQAPDLGDRRDGRIRRRDRSWVAAAGSAEDGAKRASRRERAAARSRLLRHHPGFRAYSGQPRRLLCFQFDQLADGRSQRADDCGIVGARRHRRNRGVRAVAAIYAGAIDPGRGRAP